MADTERRRYFRISDYVGLSCRGAEKVTGKERYRVGDVSITLDRLLQGMDHELNNMVNSLWQEQPVVAKAIGLLNRKITLLAAKVTQDDFDARSFVDELVPVNISACGIAFASDEPLPEGQRIALDITLKPSNTILALQGEVISCEPSVADKDKPYLIRVDFLDVGTDAEEQLIQHIVQRQSAQLSHP